MCTGELVPAFPDPDPNTLNPEDFCEASESELNALSFEFYLWVIEACIIPEPECGDNNIDVEIGEVCDDGNFVNEDGCSTECQVEDGWECNASGCT